ncbi:energy-coupling factor transporter transmembrane protein EcfT, partial [Enterococcus faecalis]
IILLQLDITIKYIFFFGNLLIQLLAALLAAVEARAVGGNIQLSTGSNLISLISLKSFTYGKKLDMVMEARGYTGQYYRVKQPLKTKDFLVSIVYLLFFGGLLYLGRN